MKQPLAERIAWMTGGALMALCLAFAYGVAVGQQPGAPAPMPGFGPGRGGIVQGTIAQKDPEHNALLINMGDRQWWVQLPEGVRILKQAPAKLRGDQEKEQLTVS